MFHLVRGSAYLLVVVRASFSFLYTDLVTISTYTVLIFDIYIYIYDDVCFLRLSLHVLFLFSLYTSVSLCTKSLFLFHTWCLDEFFFKCFRKIGCESLSYRELSSWTLFLQSFSRVVVGIDLLCNTTSGYELSDLWLLSYFICLLWFCHGLPNGEIVSTYVELVKNICHIKLANPLIKRTCNWVDLGCV